MDFQLEEATLSHCNQGVFKNKGVTLFSPVRPSLSSHHLWFQDKRRSYTDETWCTFPLGPSPAPRTQKSLMNRDLWDTRRCCCPLVAFPVRTSYFWGNSNIFYKLTFEMAHQAVGHVLVEILYALRHFIRAQVLQKPQTTTQLRFRRHHLTELEIP